MNMGSTKIKILALIAESPTYGYKISKKTGISLSSVYGHLKYFKDKELIVLKETNSKRQKIYNLSKKGKDLLDIIL